jgi:hypothetical protein
MKRAKFQLVQSTLEELDNKKYEAALKEYKKFKPMLSSRQGLITGHWVGMKNGHPYIIVTLEPNKVENPEKLLPDSLGKYEVYYIWGKLRLNRR